MIKLDENDIVLFSGDSITDGNRCCRMDLNHILGHGYQYVVAGELALKYADKAPKFINKGYSGAAMFQLLEKWDEDVIANKPTVVSILAGVNDGNIGYFEGRTPEQSAEKFYEALCKAVETTQRELPKTKIIICEPFYFPLDRTEISYRLTPSPDCEEPFKRPDTDYTDEQVLYKKNADVLIRAYAKSVAECYGCTFVSLYDCFADAMKTANPEYFIWDGTHPTVAGHMLIAKQWLKATENN